MSVVLVGVDGTETAARAAATAARLAQVFSARLLVLCAFDETAAEREGVGSDALTPRDLAERLAHQVAEPLRASYPDLRIDADAEPGRPAEALVRVAEAADALMVVIGNRRVRGVSRILGSVAIDVVRKAPCDVHIAHTQG